jgi:hypothetical protein
MSVCVYYAYICSARLYAYTHIRVQTHCAVEYETDDVCSNVLNHKMTTYQLCTRFDRMYIVLYKTVIFLSMNGVYMCQCVSVLYHIYKSCE